MSSNNIFQYTLRNIYYIDISQSFSSRKKERFNFVIQTPNYASQWALRLIFLNKAKEFQKEGRSGTELERERDGSGEADPMSVPFSVALLRVFQYMFRFPNTRNGLGPHQSKYIAVASKPKPLAQEERPPLTCFSCGLYGFPSHILLFSVLISNQPILLRPVGSKE